MKSIFNYTLKTLALTALVTFSSCSGSDANTEKALDGGWENQDVYYFTDDYGYECQVHDSFIFDSSTHEFQHFLKWIYDDEIYAKVELTGTWKASKEYIELKYQFGSDRGKLFDMNSIYINESYFDSSKDVETERKVMYEWIKQVIDTEGNTGKIKIVELTNNRLVTMDDEDTDYYDKFETVTEIEVDEVSRADYDATEVGEVEQWHLTGSSEGTDLTIDFYTDGSSVEGVLTLDDEAQIALDGTMNGDSFNFNLYDEDSNVVGKLYGTSEYYKGCLTLNCSITVNGERTEFSVTGYQQ